MGRKKKEPTYVIRVPMSWRGKRYVIYNADGSAFMSGKFLKSKKKAK